MELQTLYQFAIIFATYKHMMKNQLVKGTKLPYVVHLSNVAMEIMIASSHTVNFNLNFALPVALLHDTIEDTPTTFDEIKEHFGSDIAIAVKALSKNKELQKEQQTPDSLNRILQLPKEVWAVKLADRITNLQPPPSQWDRRKRIDYQKEARLILDKLKGGNQYLEKRLKEKIDEYEKYII